MLILLGYAMIAISTFSTLAVQYGKIDQKYGIFLVWFANITCSLVMIGFSPIVYEQICDCAFPVDENLAGTLLGYTMNVFGLVGGILAYRLDNPGIMTYVLFIGACLAFLVTALGYKEQNRRQDILGGNETHSFISFEFSDRSDSDDESLRE